MSTTSTQATGDLFPWYWYSISHQASVAPHCAPHQQPLTTAAITAANAPFHETGSIFHVSIWMTLHASCTCYIVTCQYSMSQHVLPCERHDNENQRGGDVDQSVKADRASGGFVDGRTHAKKDGNPDLHSRCQDDPKTCLLHTVLSQDVVTNAQDVTVLVPWLLPNPWRLLAACSFALHHKFTTQLVWPNLSTT